MTVSARDVAAALRVRLDAVARLVTGAQARRASGPVGPDTREAVQMRINEARAS